VLAIVLIAVASLLVYSNSFDGAMVFDDVPHIVGSRDLHDLSNVSRWWHHDSRRPIGYLTLALNYRLHGLDVRGYHITNTLIHIIGSILVYGLLLLTLSRPVVDPPLPPRTRRVLALFGALIFAVHPLQTQAVSYIVQRLASLATMFYLLSLVLYVQARVSRGRPLVRGLGFAGSAVAALLAMLTKENAFTVPIAIALYEVVFLSSGAWGRHVRDIRVWLALAVLVGSLLVVPALMSFDVSRVFATIPPEHGHSYTLTPWTYFLTQCRVLLTYLRLLVLPVHQVLDYDYPVATKLDGRTLAAMACLLGILGFAAWRLRRGDRLVGFGCLWFFLALSVESSFIPIADVIFEHRVYLAMFGFVLVVIGLLAQWPLPRAAAILAAAVVVLGITTYRRNLVWRDGLTLWSDVVRKAPNNARGNTNLGNEYLTRNQPEQARPYLERAIAINPNYGEAQTNLGSYYMERGQAALAESHLRRAVELVPDNTMAHYNLATFYLKTGRTDLAEREFDQALAIAPEFASAYTNLAICMYQTGNDDRAIAYSERAIALEPRDSRAYTNMGRAWKRKGDLQRAVSCYQRAYEIDPGALDNVINLGNAALTMNQLSVAEEWYQRALAADQRSARGLNGMGLVSYYRGDYATAIKYLEDAKASDPTLPDTYNNLSLCYSAMGRSKDAADARDTGSRTTR